MPDFPLSVLVLVFLVSITLLVKASDFFTDAAESLGINLGLPPFIVGVTIVAIGTSIPELFSSLLGVLEGAPEVVVSNVIGSNVVNICLITGIAAIASTKTLRVRYNLVKVDLPLFVGSAFLVMLMTWDQRVSQWESLILIMGYIMYLFYILKEPDEDDEDLETEPDEETQAQEQNATAIARLFLIIVISAILIFVGARYTILSLIQFSDNLNIGKELIAVSAVALGTSLPEFFVSWSASRKGKGEIAIGNILGSNIFNIFTVIGIPGLIAPLPVPDIIITQGIPTLICASLLMFFVTQDKQVTLWEGWLFLMIYAWFLGSTFHLL